MSKPTGNHEDDHDRGDLARAVRSVKKADPGLSVIDRLRSIVRERQANRVNGVLVDLFSASAAVQVYDAVNDANKERLDKLPVRKLISVCFRAIDRTRA
jgi:hypothetical protein